MRCFGFRLQACGHEDAHDWRKKPSGFWLAESQLKTQTFKGKKKPVDIFLINRRLFSNCDQLI
jgi:hypothetical protein